MHTTTRLLSLAALALPAAVPAQSIPQLVPFQEVMDLLVVDTTLDGVWRLGDRAQDGFFNEAGDVTIYYDDVTGTIPLGNPTGIVVGRTGTAYVCDSTSDIVLALDDLNGDGDALDAGEHRVFFDGTANASGIVMASAQGITIDVIGNVFVANAGTSGGGLDSILKLTDMNGDGDADDVGEAIHYCLIPNSGGAIGDSIPTKVVVAPNGKIYYTEVGATGVLQKGVYQLDDLNGDGDADDPGEWSLFWAPTGNSTAFYWGFAVDRMGVFYVTDHGNEQVWRGQDVNLDGTIIGAAEENLFYQTAASTWWDVIVHPDGPLYLAEDQTPDRVTVLEDMNGNLDALDPGEAYEAYDDTVGAADVRPRGGAFLRGPTLSVQPGTVPLGGSVPLIVTTTRPGDQVGLLLSDILLTTPFPFPPFGAFEVNPQLLLPIVSGVSDSQCVYQFTLPIPNDPALVGSYAFQAVAGNPFRLYLSNGAPLIVQ